MDELKDKCGIVGVFGNKQASYLSYLGLYALQHRGEESCGIVSFDGEQMRVHRDMGLVGDVFDKKILDSLTGSMSIGHVRYSTTGSSTLRNVQPLVIDYSRGQIAIGHNGNLVNAAKLRYELEKQGSIFQTTGDSEIIVHLLAKSLEPVWINALVEGLKQIKGAYSLVIMTRDSICAVRDPFGFKPLCLGKLSSGGYVVASETCALDLMEADFVREVEPGEIVVISSRGLESIKPFGDCSKKAHCIFEHIYFARPDSTIFGENVHTVRYRLGQQLAKEHPVSADLVMAIPDSGNSATLGYSHESGIPFQMGLIRNHYVGRTFIQPSQGIRDFNVKIKLNPIKEVLKDKNVVVIDDSIVRGTTSKARVQSLRKAGAKQIHLRISCPPHKFGCFYGIDFPSRNELIAADNNLEHIKKFLGVDSLGYLSLEGMLSCVNLDKSNYCTACFSGEYPEKPQVDCENKYSMEKRKVIIL